MQLSKIAKGLLTESTNTPTIVVDVQPAYDSSCGHIIAPLAEFINGQKKVMIMFNGEDLALDSQDAVIEYWYENGLSEEKIDEIDWAEKQYGYFRSWMDSGVPEHTIIQVIRDLIVSRKYDSRELDQDKLQAYLGDDFDYLIDDPVTIPYLRITALREYNGGYICGGGEHECLREIELFMNAMNIKYKRLSRFVY